MKARGLIDGIGDLAGLRASSKAKLVSDNVHSIAPVEESKAEVASAPLTESTDPQAPPILEECCGAPMDWEGGYRERAIEDKIREGIALIKQAIMDEAWKGVGDDGRTMKPITSETPSPWRQADKMLSKELFVDRFKPLVTGVRAVIDEYLE